MYKLAIFDMDGTLLNTLDDLAAASNYALSQAGFPGHTAEEYRYLVGRGPVNLFIGALPEPNRDEVTVKSVIDIFTRYYTAHSTDMTKPYDGVTNMLESLKGAGVSIAVFSNKPHDDVVQLSKTYFGEFVSMAEGFKYGEEIKPHPERGFKIMRHFGASADETVYIGDTAVDMQTGKNLGVYTVGVSWGFRTKDELETNGADVIIDEVAGLLKIIVDK